MDIASIEKRPCGDGRTSCVLSLIFDTAVQDGLRSGFSAVISASTCPCEPGLPRLSVRERRVQAEAPKCKRQDKPS